MTENQWRDHIAGRLREHGWHVSLTQDSRGSPPGEPDLRCHARGGVYYPHQGRPAFNVELKIRDGTSRRRPRTDTQRRWANDAIMAGQPTIEIVIPDDLDQLERYAGLPEGTLSQLAVQPGRVTPVGDGAPDVSDLQEPARSRVLAGWKRQCEERDAHRQRLAAAERARAHPAPREDNR